MSAERHPRSVLLVDSDPTVIAATRDALARREAWHPVMLISQAAEVRQYLRDSTRVNRRPAAMILRIEGAADDDGFALLEWICGEPEVAAGLPILVIGDVTHRRLPLPPQVTIADTVAPRLVIEALLRVLAALDTDK